MSHTLILSLGEELVPNIVHVDLMKHILVSTIYVLTTLARVKDVLRRPLVSNRLLVIALAKLHS